MDTTILTQFTSAHHDNINRICCPLFKKTPVSFFVYERFYDSGEALFLSSDPNVVIQWASDDIAPIRAELDLYASFGVKTAYFSHQMPLPLGANVAAEKYEKMIGVAGECKVFHILFFVSKVSNYYRICGFGTEESSKPIIDFYINSLRLLENFILHFENMASDLINEGNDAGLILQPKYHSKLVLPDDSECGIMFNQAIDYFSTQNDKDFKSQLQLTIREKECLSLIAQGYTMKSVAIKLDISHRTVEQHLRNVKDKYGLSSKNQLVELWHDYESAF